jgi:hypothetical protein
MVKNRTSQIIFQSFYCAIGLVGIVSGIIYINKLPRDTGSEQDTKTDEENND